MPKVIYLTGAPAAGKSSTTRLLKLQIEDLLVWEYGAELTKHVQELDSAVQSQDELRASSSKIITPEMVSEVDRRLLAFVQAHRESRDILIDSHPVTKESYGFRITPFSTDQFALLRPDEIWVFYTEPGETRRRISADAAGRPEISEEEARMHSLLQASLAATYSTFSRSVVLLFDTAIDQGELVRLLASRLA